MKAKRIYRDSEQEEDQSRKKQISTGKIVFPVEIESYNVITEVPDDLNVLRRLFRCAEAVSSENIDEAIDLLPSISDLSSPFGFSADRVAAYFSDALRCRIVRSCLDSHSNLSVNPLIKAQTQKINQAFQFYNSISPVIKFSHFTANQTIFEALDNEDHVHIIDFDIMQGLQWPGLFHILASRPNKIKTLRITGIGTSIEHLEATGKRLSDFANSLGLHFEFHPLEGKIGDITDPNILLKTDRKEATVVHWMQHYLYDITGSIIGTIKILKHLRPKLVTIVDRDLNLGGNFLQRFIEALQYYSALFDAIGDSLGIESVERHMVEQQLFGCEIRNLVTSDDTTQGDNWGDELLKNGFKRISLSGNPFTQASMLLGMFPWKGYTLVEDHGSLKLGWKDLSLVTASAWRPLESS